MRKKEENNSRRKTTGGEREKSVDHDEKVDRKTWKRSKDNKIKI